MHDDNWTFNSMDTKTGCQTFHTWGLKSSHWSSNIHIFLSMIASNA